MDEILHNDEWLIRYLDGELPPGQRSELEKRLRTDAALRERLTNLQVAVQAVLQMGAAETVQSVHAEMMQELKGRQKARVVPLRKVVRYSLAVAASILVLFAGVRLYQAAQLSPDGLYADAFVDFSVSAARGDNGNASEIEKHYGQKAYASVITDTRSLRLAAKDSLLVGLAYLQLEKPDRALAFFGPLSQSPNNFQQDAEFYLSLAHLKNKSYGKALTLMQTIKKNPAHLYHGQIDDDLLARVKKLSER